MYEHILAGKNSKSPKERYEYRNNCKAIAELLNSFLSGEENIPEEVFCARLICLNKCPEEKRKIDNISPISVLGFLIKLLERIILSRAERHKLEIILRLIKAK